MLKRLYANNFRCLVNFEINLDMLNLLLGPNGSGKSTIFELLFRIRHLLIDKVKTSEVFPAESRTAWFNNNIQTFELDVQGEHGTYTYKITISHNPDIKKQRVDSEQLFYNGQPLFSSTQGIVQLYHDDHTEGPKYPFDWSVSALATIEPRNDNKKLTWFKEWIQKILIIHLQPMAIGSETQEESDWLNRDGTNFASWYRYITQEHQDKTFKLAQTLRNVIPGFYSFKLEQAGKTARILKVGFNDNSNNNDIDNENEKPALYFEFDQLSDGQRSLILLYSLLLGLEDLGHTIFIDEPENFVALPEIQPWLQELSLACGDGFPQAVIISHHPELIDYLGSDCSKWIDRDPLGPTRVKPLPELMDEGLKLSEQIARGWTE